MLRAHLFRDHTPQSLNIVGELEPIAPCVIVCWYPEPARRTLKKGGLQFQVHFPGGYGLSRYCIQHWDEDLYWLTASYVDRRSATFTRFSLTRSSHELAECFVECIKAMERELTTSPSSRRLRVTDGRALASLRCDAAWPTRERSGRLPCDGRSFLPYVLLRTDFDAAVIQNARLANYQVASRHVTRWSVVRESPSSCVWPPANGRSQTLSPTDAGDAVHARGDPAAHL